MSKEELQAVAKVPRSGFKKFLLVAGGLLVAVGGAYAGGRLQMQSRLDALTESTSAAHQERDASRERQASQQRELAELEARRRIHLAIMELDRNNFGTAQGHLRAGAGLLQSAPKSADVATLTGALNTLELAPSIDQASQREALLKLAATFDAARPPMSPPPP